MGLLEDLPGPGEYTPQLPKVKNYENLLPGLQPSVDRKQPNLTRINAMKKDVSRYVKKTKSSKFPRSYSDIMKPLKFKNKKLTSLTKQLSQTQT